MSRTMRTCSPMSMGDGKRCWAAWGALCPATLERAHIEVRPCMAMWSDIGKERRGYWRVLHRGQRACRIRYMTNLRIYLFAHGPSAASARVIWAHALASQRLRVHTGEPHDRPCSAAALMRSADLARCGAHL